MKTEIQSVCLQADERAEGSLFSTQAISLHLKSLGYPESSINSMNRCGQVNCELLKHCDCGTSLIQSKHKCNLRTCPQCAKKRKGRIRHQYFPFLKSLPQDKTFFLYFLTISPENYDNLEFGLKEIRKNFRKFMRIQYIKDRIKLGIYVIEAKKVYSGDPYFDKYGNILGYHNKTGWNIHIHCIVYGRFVDNHIRGHCDICNQNLIKRDPVSKQYYCANKKCNSLQVHYNKDSKIVKIWRDLAKQDVNIHVSKQNFERSSINSPGFTLNYMLKYISVNKNDFKNISDLSEYIMVTRKQKLIATVGFITKKRLPEKSLEGKIQYHIWKISISKPERKCFCCNSNVSFIRDNKLLEIYKFSMESLPNINNLNNYLA